MFEYISTLHWGIFCIVAIIASSLFGVLLRMIQGDINRFVLGFTFHSVSTFCIVLLILSYISAGNTVQITPIGIIFAILTGIGFYVADIQTLLMFRAGAPVSLGISTIRAAVACTGVIIGVLFLREMFDLLKLIGMIAASVGIFYLMPKKQAAPTQSLNKEDTEKGT